MPKLAFNFYEMDPRSIENKNKIFFIVCVSGHCFYQPCQCGICLLVGQRYDQWKHHQRERTTGHCTHMSLSQLQVKQWGSKFMGIVCPNIQWSSFWLVSKYWTEIPVFRYFLSNFVHRIRILDYKSDILFTIWILEK